MLEAIVECLTASFPSDPSSPSAVFSKLPDGRWYGSLVRYSEPFGQGKQVLFKTSGASLDDVMRELLTALGGNDVVQRD